MAEPDVDEDLFADLYDGDDADNATDTLPAEPEAPAADDGPLQPEIEQPVIAAGDTGGVGNENYFSQEDGMQGMQGSGGYDEQEPEERSIGMKEDG